MIKKIRTIILGLTLIIVTVSVTACGSNTNAKQTTSETKKTTREVTDMAGRKVNIPAEIDKISCIHPIPSHMVWRLAPKKLASIDNQFKDRLFFMNNEEVKRLKSLPITGTFNTGDMSREQMLTIKPDIIISLKKDTNLDKEQKDYSSPVVAASKDSLLDYEESWKLIGKIVGNEKEGNELANYWHKTISEVTDKTSKIPENEKLKVYYAQSDINKTVGTKSIMASIIRDAGGINLYDTISISKADEENESITASMEQILKFDPDVIITKTSGARDEILSSPQWRGINAVKNERVYASLKYEMLDRIQSLMGLVWTANTLYPDKVNLDIDKEVKTFYSKVYLYDNITDAQIHEEITK
ncbi:ABC transporter substrate-binding protein [Clostridium kluyveri]|uniref:ABC transporter substrate-binding protein n=1 Tax=Clostridium kluyveri TaxID=1534 RepID=A0A1L5F839_CLOKL|nr:ABC transporter substrate-binding protein [Clostridium kluyveri]APM39157.1 ABC transporter substrate-binding protein [Clostridium kluyveri]UZQ51484.1 ABC transporter substrate-binding protein [Clostridium kluyveri]